MILHPFCQQKAQRLLRVAPCKAVKAQVLPPLIGEGFDQQPVANRIAILAAGPLANLIFAILALWLVFAVGIPGVRPVVGELQPQGIAAKAGLQPGMIITAVNQAGAFAA